MSPRDEKTTLPGDNPGTVRQEVQLACFRVGSVLYALEIMRIKEIIRPQKLTPIPKAPPFIEGVINLRGAVIPIVDLRKRFDIPTVTVDRKTRVIICALFGKILGLVVDEVAEVRRYSRQEIQPSPQFLQGKGAEYFHGICRREEDLVMVLNLETLLSSSEKIDLETIQQVQREVENA
jgi:purine-binding chemotaxis protein CheW